MRVAQQKATSEKPYGSEVREEQKKEEKRKGKRNMERKKGKKKLHSLLRPCFRCCCMAKIAQQKQCEEGTEKGKCRMRKNLRSLRHFAGGPSGRLTATP